MLRSFSLYVTNDDEAPSNAWGVASPVPVSTCHRRGADASVNQTLPAWSYAA